MKTKLLLLGLVAALLMSVAMPSLAGQSRAAAPAVQATHSAPAVQATHNPPAFLDRTRFLLHAGAAFFIIHHEYKRFKEGWFASGTAHRTRHIVVAAAALLIAYHEAKVAYGIAQKSNSKTLHALTAPISALVAAVDSVHTRLTQGQVATADFQNLNNDTSSINSTAGHNGFGSIPDRSVPLPSGA